MTPLQTIVHLVNQKFDQSITLDELKKVSFNIDEKPHSFREFLKKNRLIPFVQIAVLLKYLKDSKMVVGSTSAEYFEYPEYADGPGAETLGPAITPHLFESKSVFDFLLQMLGVTAIITDDHSVQQYENRLSPEGEIKNIDSYFNDVFIAIDPLVVMTENEIYCPLNLAEGIQGIIEFHMKQFEKFLQNNDISKGVPHSIYIEWLLAWFPGEVRTRLIK